MTMWNPMMAMGGMWNQSGNQMPAKKFKGKGGVAKAVPGGMSETGIGEVRFETAKSSQKALRTMDGSVLEGAVLSLTLDSTSADGTKLRIEGLPAGVEWQELKDHFASVGNLAFVNIKGGKRSGPRLKGEVRFHTAQAAAAAMAQLQGSEMEGGGNIKIMLDPSSKDATKLIITEIPPGTGWQDLKDLFASTGLEVIFANVVNPSSDLGFAEVRYDSVEDAQQALQTLNGTSIMGSKIFISAAPNSVDGTKLFVQGLGSGVAWQEVKDHFRQIGEVAFCQVTNTNKGFGKGGMKGGMMPMMMGKGMMGGMYGGWGGMMGKGGRSGLTEQQAFAMVEQAWQQGQMACAVVSKGGWSVQYM